MLVGGLMIFNFSLADEEEEIAERIENVKKATVVIVNDQMKTPGKFMTGSGFVYSSPEFLADGSVKMKILTNAHVVEDYHPSDLKAIFKIGNRTWEADGLSATLNPDYPAKFTGDVAVLEVVFPPHKVGALKVLGLSLPKPVELRTTPLPLESDVRVIGWRYSEELLRQEQKEYALRAHGTRYGVIVSSGSAEPGVSGSPMIDSNGQVVGIYRGFLRKKYLGGKPVGLTDPLVSIGKVKEIKFPKEFKKSGHFFQGITDFFREFSERSMKETKKGRPPGY